MSVVLACRLMQAEEIDRPGVKVAVAQGLAPDGFLTSSAWSSRDRISRRGRLTTTIFPARENTCAGCNGCPSATPASRSSMELVYTFRAAAIGTYGPATRNCESDD